MKYYKMLNIEAISLAISLLSFLFLEKFHFEIHFDISFWGFFQNIKNDCEKIYKPQRKNNRLKIPTTKKNFSHDGQIISENKKKKIKAQPRRAFMLV